MNLGSITFEDKDGELQTLNVSIQDYLAASCWVPRRVNSLRILEPVVDLMESDVQSDVQVEITYPRFVDQFLTGGIISP